MGNGKKEAFQGEAFRLFSEGKTLKEISRLIGVSEQSLCKWKADDNWEDRVDSLITTPGGAAAILREALAEYVSRIQASGIDKEVADSISKITASIRTLEGQEDFLGSCIRVMRRFGEFIRETRPKMTEEMQGVIQEFFSVVERER